jgi:hypothetical protein
MVKTPTKGTPPLASASQQNMVSPPGSGSVRGFLSPLKSTGDKKNKINKILILVDSDGAPIGWAFKEFYDVKEYLKAILNRVNMETHIGGIPFKAFSNLTTKWTLASGIGQNLWIICIDPSRNDLENSFPTKAYMAFANKIACAIIGQKIYPPGTVEVEEIVLYKSTIDDLSAHFSLYSYDEAKDQIFQESIKAVDVELEDLI